MQPEVAVYNEFLHHDQKKTQTIADDGFVLPRNDLSCFNYSCDLNQDLLIKGHNELMKHLNIVKGQLTQSLYKLLISNSLTKDTLLECSDKVNSSTVENKFVLLKRRYFLDNLGRIHDNKRNDAVVLEPEQIFHVIMLAHLMNNHASAGKLHDRLKIYANITRAFTKMSLAYCSYCNPTCKVKPYKKFKHYNIYKSLMPMERCHIEIFQPFEDDILIENQYSHVLYCRDYHSRFIWLLPLKGITFRDLVPNLAKLLLNMIRIPIFIETTTLNRQDMFDMCEYIARKYKLKLGLGLNNNTNFQRHGITRIKTLFDENRNECIDDWNMCLRIILGKSNYEYNDSILGIPNDRLCNEFPQLSKNFKMKQNKIIHELFAHHVVQFSEAGGLIYLEDEDNPYITGDEWQKYENECDSTEVDGTKTDLSSLKGNDHSNTNENHN